MPQEVLPKITEKLFEVSANFNRPANTTQYAAGDAITDATSSATAMTFTDVVTDIGSYVEIREVVVTVSTAQSTLPTVNVWLFDTIPTAPNDNSAMTLTDAENNNCKIVVPVFSAFSATNNARLENANVDRRVKLASSSKDLYGLIEVTNAYTPASAETFTVTIRGQRL